MNLNIIARIYTDYKEKFGIPRQSGTVCGTYGRIVFEKEYRRPEALRGLEGYSHIWLIWEFSEAKRDGWSPTVRPPRLGGNKRMGVFATRSPFRPNNLGLSAVKLIEILHTENEGDVLIVDGADMLSGTPIYDIKPYLSYTDSHPDAVCGFAEEVRGERCCVNISDEILSILPAEKREPLIEILRQDPSPGYKNSGEYAFLFSDYEVFYVYENDCITVKKIIKR